MERAFYHCTKAIEEIFYVDLRISLFAFSLSMIVLWAGNSQFTWNSRFISCIWISNALVQACLCCSCYCYLFTLFLENFWQYAGVICLLNNFTILYIYIYLFSVCVCLLWNFRNDCGNETGPILRLHRRRCARCFRNTDIVTVTLFDVDAVRRCLSANFTFFVRLEGRHFLFGNDCFWGCTSQLRWMQLIPRGSYVCSYARVV